jgi:hypothetical protein
MTPKYQIFVSSTYVDLKEERDQVVKAILEMGHIPVGMEMFSAGDESQWQIIKRTIDESDYYVVIVAHRYGSMERSVSYTEKEFDYAVKARIPVLAFMIDDSVPWPPDRTDNEKHKVKGLAGFKKKLKRRMIKTWKSAEHLHGEVVIALTKQIALTPRIGWVRASPPISPEVTQELSRLSRENSEIRGELADIKECATTLHKINHSYRDALRTVFGSPTRLRKALEEIELDNLRLVCERIAEMFTSLIKAKCVVTVKLIREQDDNGKRQSSCHTLVRSESGSERDRQLVAYQIGKGANTAFDVALKYNPHGPSRFFSPDLVKDYEEGIYSNERTDWRHFYRSALVVPIRSVTYEHLPGRAAFNNLGFLAVDTLAPNKLNETFHLQFLAAFADQMFNFMSLMRGRYRFPRTEPTQGTI